MKRNAPVISSLLKNDEEKEKGNRAGKRDGEADEVVREIQEWNSGSK